MNRQNDFPRAHELHALFDRMRRVELLLAVMFGSMLAGGGAIGAKVFGLIR